MWKTQRWAKEISFMPFKIFATRVTLRNYFSEMSHSSTNLSSSNGSNGAARFGGASTIGRTPQNMSSAHAQNSGSPSSSSQSRNYFNRSTSNTAINNNFSSSSLVSGFSISRLIIILMKKHQTAESWKNNAVLSFIKTLLSGEPVFFPFHEIISNHPTYILSLSFSITFSTVFKKIMKLYSSRSMSDEKYNFFFERVNSLFSRRRPDKTFAVRTFPNAIRTSFFKFRFHFLGSKPFPLMTGQHPICTETLVLSNLSGVLIIFSV